MRNLFLAFGLVLLFAAAPVVAAPLTVTNAQKALGVDHKGRLKRDLKKVVRRNQAAIDFICKAKPKCWAQSNIAQQGMLSVYMRRISAARACARLSVGKAVMCLIETGDKAFFPAIEAAIERQERARKALRFLQEKGCTFKGGQIKCAGFSPIGVILFFITLLGSRRSERETWWSFEALGYLDARKMVWVIEDELWKARWIERAIEAFITLTAFSLGGLVLGITSTLLAQKRYGWGSIFALLISVLFWGSALEWVLFAIKAVVTFLANTNEGFELLRRIAHWRWKRQISKLK